MAYRVDDLIMAANAGYRESALDVADDGWIMIADSTAALSGRAASEGDVSAAVAPMDAGTGHDVRGIARLTLPARSFTVWRLRADDAQ